MDILTAVYNKHNSTLGLVDKGAYTFLMVKSTSLVVEVYSTGNPLVMDTLVTPPTELAAHAIPDHYKTLPGSMLLLPTQETGVMELVTGRFPLREAISTTISESL